MAPQRTLERNLREQSVFRQLLKLLCKCFQRSALLTVRTYESKGRQTQVEWETHWWLAPHCHKVGSTSLGGIFLPLCKFIFHPLFSCPDRVCGQLNRWPYQLTMSLIADSLTSWPTMTRFVTFETFDQSYLRQFLTIWTTFDNFWNFSDHFLPFLKIFDIFWQFWHYFTVFDNFDNFWSFLTILDKFDNFDNLTIVEKLRIFENWFFFENFVFFYVWDDFYDANFILQFWQFLQF